MPFAVEISREEVEKRQEELRKEEDKEKEKTRQQRAADAQSYRDSRSNRSERSSENRSPTVDGSRSDRSTDRSEMCTDSKSQKVDDRSERSSDSRSQKVDDKSESRSRKVDSRSERSADSKSQKVDNRSERSSDSRSQKVDSRSERKSDGRSRDIHSRSERSSGSRTQKVDDRTKRSRSSDKSRDSRQNHAGADSSTSSKFADGTKYSTSDNATSKVGENSGTSTYTRSDPNLRSKDRYVSDDHLKTSGLENVVPIKQEPGLNDHESLDYAKLEETYMKYKSQIISHDECAEVDPSEPISSQYSSKMSGDKVLSSLKILSDFSNKFGVMGNLLPIIHTKACHLSYKGLEPLSVFDDDDNVTLLTLLKHKLPKLKNYIIAQLDRGNYLKIENILRMLSDAVAANNSEVSHLGLDINAIASATKGFSAESISGFVNHVLAYEHKVAPTPEQMRIIGTAITEKHFEISSSMSRPILKKNLPSQFVKPFVQSSQPVRQVASVVPNVVDNISTPQAYPEPRPTTGATAHNVDNLSQHNQSNTNVTSAPPNITTTENDTDIDLRQVAPHLLPNFNIKIPDAFGLDSSPSNVGSTDLDMRNLGPRPVLLPNPPNVEAKPTARKVLKSAMRSSPKDYDALRNNSVRGSKPVSRWERESPTESNGNEPKIIDDRVLANTSPLQPSIFKREMQGDIDQRYFANDEVSRDSQKINFMRRDDTSQGGWNTSANKSSPLHNTNVSSRPPSTDPVDYRRFDGKQNIDVKPDIQCQSILDPLSSHNYPHNSVNVQDVDLRSQSKPSATHSSISKLDKAKTALMNLTHILKPPPMPPVFKTAAPQVYDYTHRNKTNDPSTDNVKVKIEVIEDSLPISSWRRCGPEKSSSSSKVSDEEVYSRRSPVRHSYNSVSQSYGGYENSYVRKESSDAPNANLYPSVPAANVFTYGHSSRSNTSNIDTGSKSPLRGLSPDIDKHTEYNRSTYSRSNDYGVNPPKSIKSRHLLENPTDQSIHNQSDHFLSRNQANDHSSSNDNFNRNEQSLQKQSSHFSSKNHTNNQSLSKDNSNRNEQSMQNQYNHLSRKRTDDHSSSKDNFNRNEQLIQNQSNQFSFRVQADGNSSGNDNSNHLSRNQKSDHSSSRDSSNRFDSPPIAGHANKAMDHRISGGSPSNGRPLMPPPQFSFGKKASQNLRVNIADEIPRIKQEKIDYHERVQPPLIFSHLDEISVVRNNRNGSASPNVDSGTGEIMSNTINFRSSRNDEEVQDILRESASTATDEDRPRNMFTDEDTSSKDASSVLRIDPSSPVIPQWESGPIKICPTPARVRPPMSPHRTEWMPSSQGSNIPPPSPWLPLSDRVSTEPQFTNFDACASPVLKQSTHILSFLQNQSHLTQQTTRLVMKNNRVPPITSVPPLSVDSLNLSFDEPSTHTDVNDDYDHDRYSNERHSMSPGALNICTNDEDDDRHFKDNQLFNTTADDSNNINNSSSSNKGVFDDSAEHEKWSKEVLDNPEDNEKWNSFLQECSPRDESTTGVEFSVVTKKSTSIPMYPLPDIVVLSDEEVDDNERPYTPESNSSQPPLVMNETLTSPVQDTGAKETEAVASGSLVAEDSESLDFMELVELLKNFNDLEKEEQKALSSYLLTLKETNPAAIARIYENAREIDN